MKRFAYVTGDATAFLIKCFIGNEREINFLEIDWWVSIRNLTDDITRQKYMVELKDLASRKISADTVFKLQIVA